MTIRSVIKGCGSYLPANIMTNADISKIVETDNEWIVKRTGIEQRHIARKDELTSDMALAAAKKALADAKVDVKDLDGIVLATTTPDNTFPATAVKIQAALGMHHGFAFDVQAVCSGFVYALRTADNMIRCGQAKNILVIGAEKFSSILDWTDRTTCVLFGDGAGAFVLQANESDDGRGILSTHIHSDGRYHDMLYVDGGVSSNQQTGFVRMEGKEVFKHAVQNLSDVVDEVLTHNNFEASQIDWLVPHQANARIIEGTAKKLGMSMDKVVMTVSKHGNTSAASIPLAFCDAYDKGSFKKNDIILIEAMGAGFTWGAALVRF